MAIEFNGRVPLPWLTFLEGAVFVTILCQLTFFINDLYNTEVQLGLGDMLWRIVLAFAASSLVLAGLYLFFPSLEPIKRLLLYSILIALVLICFWRVLFGWIIIHLFPRKNILILGSGPLARLVAKELLNRPLSQYHLEGLLGTNLKNPGKMVMGLNAWEVESEYTRELITRKKIRQVIVAVSQRRENLPLEFLLQCKSQGIEILDSSKFYEQLTGKILISELRPNKLIFFSGFREKGFYQVSKQVLDFAFALLYLLISSPLLLLISLLIKLDSPGPVFLTQERVGKNGRPFILIKFRSMYSDAEESTGPVWASEDDPRITRVGRVIRRLRLDELPQMINVLKGEMSLVGPRPERPYFVDKLQQVIPYYKQRLVVKPGITGWAAVKYQYASSVESAQEKLQYDLYYIKNRSFILDTLTILKTIQVMITGKGSK